MNKPKNATDAAGHIVKLLNPGVPYSMQGVGAQKIVDYVKQRDAAIAQVLCDLLEGELKDEVKWQKAKYDVKSVEAVCFNRGIRKAQALIRQTLDPISSNER